MKKRILFINGHLNTGGIERSLVDVLCHLDESKYDVDLLLLQGGGDYENEIPKFIHTYVYYTDKAFGPFFKSMRTNLRFLNLWAILFRLAWTLYKRIGNKALILVKLLLTPCFKHYDVAIAYRPGMCNTLLAYAINATKKISWWHHGKFLFDNASKTNLHGEYLKCTNIVTVSANTNNTLSKVFPDFVTRLITINNMVCTDDIFRKSKIFAVVKNDNILSVVSVGRLYHDKNVQMCSKIAHKLKLLGIPFVWYLIGEGDERPVIEKDIAEHGLQNQLILTGALSNPYPYIANADILFHASPIESQGLTILEAMALGTPVVCVSSAGPREFITNGENGIMIDNNVEQAVNAISRLHVDTALRKKLSESASNTVKQFMPEIEMAKIESLF